MMSRISFCLCAFFVAATLGACGGSSYQSSSTPAPPATPPSTSAPAPAPSPTPSPTPTASSTPDNFQASVWFVPGRTNAVAGMLTLNATSNNGSGTVQFNRPTSLPNSNFTIYFSHFSSPSTKDKFQVGTFSTDANGSANPTFQFPSKGNFAGIFGIFLQTSSGEDAYFGTGPNPVDPAYSGLTYSVPLLPASSISGGVAASTGTAAGAGRVSVTAKAGQVSLAGAQAAHSFTVAVCGQGMQNCVTLGTLATDAQGNASGSFSMTGTGIGGNFVLSDTAGAEYISGFHVQ